MVTAFKFQFMLQGKLAFQLLDTWLVELYFASYIFYLKSTGPFVVMIAWAFSIGTIKILPRDKLIVCKNGFTKAPGFGLYSYVDTNMSSYSTL